MKVVGLGDSITYGFPYGPEVSWLAQLDESLNVQTINYGINGESTEEMLRRVQNVIVEEPNVVIIMGGTNDAYEELVPQLVLSNIKKMIEKLRQELEDVYIYLGIPPVVKEVETEQLLDVYRKRMKLLADKEKMEVIDFHNVLSSNDLIDSCHPTEIGYKKMSELAFRALKHRV